MNLGESPVNLGESPVNLGESPVSLDCSEEINSKKELICEYCKQSFKRKDYLETHLKKSCKMLKEFNNIYNFDKKTFGTNIYKGHKNAGDIYIIQTDYISKDHYKVGITNNIQKRLCSYRYENKYEPRLHYYFSCYDIKLIDNILKAALVKNNVKKEIFQGDVEDLKNIIINILKNKLKLKKVHIHEPDIKIGDLSKCRYCDICFYSKKDLFDHFNNCDDYKKSLAKGIELKCKYCEKTFSKNSNLARHLKFCKEKKKDDDEKANLLNLVEMLNQQLKEQKVKNDEQKEQFQIELNKRDEQLIKRDHQIDELIKKTGITQNIQNNIKILAYKNTDISHLTDQDYLQCLNRSNMCIPNLIKRIHFDPKKPENHNIYISNIKNKYVMIYDGIKWNLHNRDETIEGLIDENQFVLEQKLEEWLENGKEYPEIMKKFNRYLEKKEKDNVINKIKEEIKLILFNNRNAIEII